MFQENKSVLFHTAHRQPARRHSSGSGDIEAMLNDMAFVLHLTGSVKQEILAEKEAGELVAV
jgi:hypothetical protein